MRRPGGGVGGPAVLHCGTTARRPTCAAGLAPLLTKVHLSGTLDTSPCPAPQCRAAPGLLRSGLGEQRRPCHVYGQAKSASSPSSNREPLGGRRPWTWSGSSEDDATAVTAAQLCAGVYRLISVGQWARAPRISRSSGRGIRHSPGVGLVPAPLVERVGRVRGDLVMPLPKPRPRGTPGAYPWDGRPPQHGKEFRFAESEAWPEPAVTPVTRHRQLRQGGPAQEMPRRGYLAPA